MKISFWSESQIAGKIPRDFENARTEYSWAIALDASFYNITRAPLGKRFDLGIVIIPKNNPDVDLTIVRKSCNKVAIMQEGPHWFFQDYTIDKQFHYYNILLEADWVYCHNESDIKYYKGLGCKDVRVMRSLMIPDGLEPRVEHNKDNVIIGGNFVSWYGGFDSYIVARELDKDIWAPSMGRKQKLEDEIKDINYLPYMSWRDWIDELKHFDIGIHLMRTHAAGTFAMNLAYHKIPCVGYRGLDAQDKIHLNTTVEVGDLVKAKDIAIRLQNDKDFYNECSEIVGERFNQLYTEEKWLHNWRYINEIT